MSLPPDQPIFLERAAYRRRRLQDAARLLPMVTLAALLLPSLTVAGVVEGLYTVFACSLVRRANFRGVEP